MDWILYFITFILGVIIVYIGFYIKPKPKNNVHFYVARDKNGRLFLYLSKPFRRGDEFFSNEHGNIMLHDLKNFGLNPDDFKDLKWEDEPVEVFVNMEENL